MKAAGGRSKIVSTLKPQSSGLCHAVPGGEARRGRRQRWEEWGTEPADGPAGFTSALPAGRRVPQIPRGLLEAQAFCWSHGDSGGEVQSPRDALGAPHRDAHGTRRGQSGLGSTLTHLTVLADFSRREK